MSIHPTAVVNEEATLGEVEIGPFAVIGAGVELADGVKIGAHCVLEGPMVVGKNTVLHPHVVLGGSPQDAKHDPAIPTHLVIGQSNVFREFSSAHRGSSGGNKVTVIGSNNYFMANSHVAHDCVIGSGVMFANSAAVAGFVQVGDGAILGGLCAIHQYCRIGRLAMVGGGAMCAQDVPPFTLAQGDRARLFGLNIIGLRRAGFTIDAVTRLKEAWRTLFMDGFPKRVAMSRVEASHGDLEEVRELLAFLGSTDRGVCRAGLSR